MKLYEFMCEFAFRRRVHCDELRQALSAAMGLKERQIRIARNKEERDSLDVNLMHESGELFFCYMKKSEESRDNSFLTIAVDCIISKLIQPDMDFKSCLLSLAVILNTDCIVPDESVDSKQLHDRYYLIKPSGSIYRVRVNEDCDEVAFYIVENLGEVMLEDVVIQ